MEPKTRFQKADTALAALAGTPDEDLYDRAGTRHDRALVRLLRTPAPHAAALADKIDLLIAHRAWEFRAADACLAALSSDARRLARARTDPAVPFPLTLSAPAARRSQAPVR